VASKAYEIFLILAVFSFSWNLSTLDPASSNRVRPAQPDDFYLSDLTSLHIIRLKEG